MLSNHKKLAAIDSPAILSGNNVVLGLKFDNKNIVKDIIKKVKDEVLGLNLKIDGNSMIHKNKEEIKEHQLPPSPNFQTIRLLAEWAAYQYLPIIYNELGTIAANDDTIILCLNHSVSDGKNIAGLARHLQEKRINMNGYTFQLHLKMNFLKKLKNA